MDIVVYLFCCPAAIINRFIHTWEVVQSCALADGSRELLFLKVVIELSVDGLRRVGGALV